ncbi:hypothetical protein H257_15663 [Aphanomyces astaci]|uniref:Uncharacterized protein n=1 Tax=Aphanomyces astaci TaxID=112090 RepID=W4FLI0_APHAT|nr:hypothetical protein H257_15663 [Aphanomyces astaci]ETV68340.1 hypothetical protein H257_15663 [Aphanomyces astaci]|eukprot:XP_009842135.1 hypothetical protein H257_15663 [Aphanomyces astaci]
MVSKPLDFHKRPVEDTHNVRHPTHALERLGVTCAFIIRRWQVDDLVQIRQNNLRYFLDVVICHGNPVADGEDCVVMQGLVKLAPSVLDFGRAHTKRRPAASEVSVKPTIELFVVLHTSPVRVVHLQTSLCHLPRLDLMTNILAFLTVFATVASATANQNDDHELDAATEA